MHYPPETSSIMLMARMVATVKQVGLQFGSTAASVWFPFPIVAVILED